MTSSVNHADQYLATDANNCTNKNITLAPFGTQHAAFWTAVVLFCVTLVRHGRFSSAAGAGAAIALPPPEHACTAWACYPPRLGASRSISNPQSKCWMQCGLFMRSRELQG